MAVMEPENEGREPGDVGDDADALPDAADLGDAELGRDVDEPETSAGDEPDEEAGRGIA
jgi:hypothetical protein